MRTPNRTEGRATDRPDDAVADGVGRRADHRGAPRRAGGALALALALALGGAAHAQQDEGDAAAAAPEDAPAATGGAGETDTAGAADAASGADAGGATADAAGGSGECAAGDDFPTTAVADYVLGCMAANGNTYEALQQCSCSIDFIKARMDYKTYEQAGTIMQVQRDVGQRGIFYRDSNWAKSRIDQLQSLQAESTLRCF